MNDILVSIVRTLVPIAAGAFVAVLALGEARAILAGAGVITAYYLAVRLAERRWPRVGWLLGTARQPTYGEAVRRGPHLGPGLDVGQRYSKPYTS